jgi:membrane associated rhomboid family serine protease
MGFAEVFDRIFWSAMIVIFVALLWLKFLDPIVAIQWTGFIVSLIVGFIYFYVWWRKMRRELKMGRELEEGDM